MNEFGQQLNQFGQNIDPQTRAGIRDLIQGVAQGYFNRFQPVPQYTPPPPPKVDYTPFLIAGAASIVAALIIANAGRKK